MNHAEELELSAVASQKNKERYYWIDEVFAESLDNFFVTASGLQHPGGVPGEAFSQKFILDKAVSDKVLRICGSSDTSLHAILFTALGCLFSRQQNVDEVLIATGIFGRDKQSTGKLLNDTLAVRNSYSSEKSFRQLLKEIAGKMQQAVAHQNYPVRLLMNQLNREHDTMERLQFSTGLLLENLQPGIPAEALANIVFSWHRTNNTLECTIYYHGNCTADEIARYYDRLATLLDRLTDQPGEPIGNISMLSCKEWHTCFHEFNNTAYDYGTSWKCLSEIIEARVKEMPESIALKWDDGTLSFSQLNDKANRLAWNIRGRGIGRGDVVAVLADRSPEMVTAIYGIVKSGAAYMPLDPAAPADSIAYKVSDSGCKLAFCSTRYTANEGMGGITVLDLGNEAEYDFANENPPCENTGADIAYVIYTSGSTGRPKGVMSPHAGLLNRIFWMQKEYQLSCKDTILQKTNYTFDVSVWEFFWGVFAGCSLYLLKPGDESDPEKIVDTINHAEVTVLHFVPSMFAAFLEYAGQSQAAAKLSSVRYIMASGEALNYPQVNRLNSLLTGAMLVNLYGPTEASIDVSYYNCPKGIVSSNIPIGKPIDNIHIFITDRHMNLAGAGMTGELCIGGAGLAAGYINNPGLTEQKFVTVNWYNGRLYRTGDLASWQPDGTIMYHGRTDFQVKLRGYRIEPGEIETVLSAYPQLQNVVVLISGKNDADKKLVAYYTAAGTVSASELQQYLAEKLPHYMIPSFFIQLSSFPLTASGKINRGELPAVEDMLLKDEGYTEPETETEKKLGDIWMQGLQLLRAGRDDSFFDWGGDSIKAIRLINQIRSVFGKDVRIADLYRLRTLGALAQYTDSAAIISDDQNRELLAAEKEIEVIRAGEMANMSNPGEIEDLFPMSDIQSGMVYTSIINPGLGIYHDQFLYNLPEKVDDGIFEKALLWMTAKHGVLRTSFYPDRGPEGLQVVYKNVQPVFKTVDLDGSDSTGADRMIKEYVIHQRTIPFDFEKAPLWRATLFHINERTVFLFQFHHAILDGWSVASFNTELNDVYRRIQQSGTLVPPVSLKCSYRDFIVHAAAVRNSDTNRIFWQQELADLKPLALFTATDVNEKVSRVFDTDFLQKLRLRAAEDKVHLKSIFFAAFACVMRMFTYEKECTLGLVTNNRPVLEDADKLLGCFLNTIPVRVKDPAAGTSWKEFVTGIDDKLSQLRERENTTLREIAGMLRHKVSDGNPFFDVAFNYTNFHIYEPLIEKNVTAKEDRTTPLDDLSHEITNTFLNLTVNLTGDVMSLNFTLRKKMRNNKSAGDILYYMTRFLDNYTENAGSVLRADLLMPEAEHEFLLKHGTGAIRPGTDKITVPAMFEAQVQLQPDNTAIIFNSERLTYRQLDERSNQLAWYLKQAGVQPGTHVGICLERGIEMITGILAVLKAGAAYVPIDPEYPSGRISYMLNDAGIKTVLVDSRGQEAIAEAKGNSDDTADKKPFETINLVTAAALISEQPADSLPVPGDPSAVAYVIYTSGSTGKPKGVLCRHGGLSNRIVWAQEQYQLTPHDAILQKTTFCFDVSVWELLWPLAAGARLVFAAPGGHKNTEYLAGIIQKEQITLMHFVPSMLEAFLENETAAACTSLRQVLCSGEALTPAQAALFRKKLPATALDNLYGPTEASIDVSWWNMTENWREEDVVPIGRPVFNTQLYILNTSGQLAPAGIPGELHIAGLQLAGGYLNKPELTSKSFIPNPFSTSKDSLMYKTGDLARWLPDGNIEYLGRTDEQVKIRGYRIELGEVEAQLQQCSGVKKAVVTASATAAGDTALTAYIDMHGVLDKQLLINELSRLLPEYMIPRLWVQLDEFPLNANGKIDKKALPKPDATALLQQEYVAPRNETEQQLAEIWVQLLKIEKAGIYDNFFDLGGHSLHALRMLSAVNRQFNLSISFQTIFSFRCIAELAAYIELVMAGRTASQETGVEVFEI